MGVLGESLREWGMLIKGGNKYAHDSHNPVETVVVGRVINSTPCT